LRVVWWAGSESNTRHEDFQPSARVETIDRHHAPSATIKGFPALRAIDSGRFVHIADDCAGKATGNVSGYLSAPARMINNLQRAHNPAKSLSNFIRRAFTLPEAVADAEACA
jgi:hypothetical protein